MTCSLTSCLDTAPQTPYALYVKHKINSMPSTRNCTQPLLIWKRHSILYPDSQTCHLVGSLQVWRWGEAGMAHTKHVWKCRKLSACCLQPEWRVQRESGCSPSLLPKPPAVHYSSRSPIPVPYSSIHDVPGKACVQMAWLSSLNSKRNCKRSWSSGRPIPKERDFGSTWAKPRSWIWAGARCASEVW